MTAHFKAEQVGRTGDAGASAVTLGGQAMWKNAPTRLWGQQEGGSSWPGTWCRGLGVPLGKRHLPREVGAGKQESRSGMGWGGRVVWSSTLGCFGAAEPPLALWLPVSGAHSATAASEDEISTA